MSSAPVAWLLIALNVAIGLVTLRWRRDAIDAGVLRPAAVWRGARRWTLVTSAFLHADLAHLAFNMVTLSAFGPALETQIGSASFAALYAAGVVGSSLWSTWRHRREAGYATLGASGAVLAVLFAFIVHQPGARMVVFPLPIPVPAPLFALLYAVWSIVSARHDDALRRDGRAGASGINHGAHLAGAAVGLAFVALTDPAAFMRAARWLLG